MAGQPDAGTSCATADGSQLKFQASCRPYSWSLYGAHVTPSAGTTPLRARPTSLRSRTAPPEAGWDDEAAEAAVFAVHALGAQLGTARLWLGCRAGLPSHRSITALAGAAALRRVPLQALGLEVSLRALCEFDGDAVARVAALREAGFDVAVRVSLAELQSEKAWTHASAVPKPAWQRLPVPAGQWPSQRLMSLANVVSIACARRVSLVVADVEDRGVALLLGQAGVAAVLGPAVGAPMPLVPFRAFLGPCEKWLANMQADSM